MQTQISIHGFLVGPIWWPVGAECWKHLSYDLTDHDSRFVARGTLRDHVLTAINDGDFQHCVIARGEIVIQTTCRNNAGETIRRSRSWPLDRFPSIRDCLHADPDWFPESSEDE